MRVVRAEHPLLHRPAAPCCGGALTPSCWQATCLGAVCMLLMLLVPVAGFLEISTVAGSDSTTDDPVDARFAAFDDMYHIAVSYDQDSDKVNVWVADSPNNRIRLVLTNGTVATIAGSGATSGAFMDGLHPMQTRFAYPRAVAVLPEEAANERDPFNVTFWVCDTNYHRIRRVSPGENVSTVVGSALGSRFAGDNGPSTSASLSNPAHLVVRRNTSSDDILLWVVDTYNDRIRLAVEGGNITTVAGSDATTDGNMPAFAAALSSPGYIQVTWNATAGTPILWVADTSNHRVRWVGPDGITRTVVGVGGTSGSTGMDGPADQALLNYPRGFSVVSTSAQAHDAGNVTLYIADQSNRRIVRADVGGNVSVVAGSGGYGNTGDGGPAVAATFSSPSVVRAWYNATSKGTRLWVVDSSANAVRAIDEDGIISTIAGADATMRNEERVPAHWAPTKAPNCIAALPLPSGGVGVWYCDTSNYRLRYIDAEGYVTTIAGTGTNQYLFDGVRATEAPVGTTKGIAVVLDVSGNATVYFSQSSHARVRCIDAAGFISTVAGSGQAGYAGDDGPAQAARLNQPNGLAALRNPDTGAVTLWIADASNNCVRMVAESGNITTVAGRGDVIGFAGDGGPATTAALDYPWSVAALRNATTGGVTLWIAEYSGHRIRRVSSDGIITTVVGGAGPGYSGNGVLAATSNIYNPLSLSVLENVTDGQPIIWFGEGAYKRVWRVSTDGYMHVVAGDPNSLSFGEGGPPTAASVGYPIALSVLFDPATGNETVWIADSTQHRLHRSITGSVFNTIVGSLDAGGPATLAMLASPQDLAVDVNETSGGVAIWIADYSNYCIRHVSEAGVISRAAGVGISGFPNNGEPALTSLIRSPRSVTVQRNATTGGVVLWFTTANDIRVFRVSETGILYVVAGGSANAIIREGVPAIGAEFKAPTKVDVLFNANDGTTVAWVLDSDSNRIRRFELGGNISTVMGGLTDGGLATQARLNRPTGIAVEMNATTQRAQFWIADSEHCRVRHVAEDGIITTVAGVGAPGTSGDGAQARLSLLSYPYAVAVRRDPATDTYTVWFSEPNFGRIRYVASDGILRTAVGGGPLTPTLGDGGPALSAVLRTPRGLALLCSNETTAEVQLFIADVANKRIRKAVVGGHIESLAGGNFHGAPALKARLVNPSGVVALLNESSSAVDVWISDTNAHCIRQLGADGILRTVVGIGLLGFGGDNGPAVDAYLRLPWGIAVTYDATLAAHVVWIADYENSRIRRAVVGGTITTVAGGGGVLAPVGLPATQALLNRPIAVAALANVSDSSRVALWFVDYTQHTAYHVAENGSIFSVAGVSTARGYGGDDGLALYAVLYEPKGIAVLRNESTGGVQLWISDSANYRVRHIAENGTITTVAGTGGSGLSQDGALAREATISYPTDLTVTRNRTTGEPVLWLMEQSYSRVRQVSSEGILTTIAGSGSSTLPMRGDGGQANFAYVSQPRAVSVQYDAALNKDRVWIAEASGGNRIRHVMENGATPTGTPSPSVTRTTSRTPSRTRTPSQSPSSSGTASITPTISFTATVTPSPTQTPSATGSWTPSPSPVRVVTPQPTQRVIDFILRV